MMAAIHSVASVFLGRLLSTTKISMQQNCTDEVSNMILRRPSLSIVGIQRRDPPNWIVKEIAASNDDMKLLKPTWE